MGKSGNSHWFIQIHLAIVHCYQNQKQNRITLLQNDIHMQHSLIWLNLQMFCDILIKIQWVWFCISSHRALLMEHIFIFKQIILGIHMEYDIQI